MMASGRDGLRHWRSISNGYINIYYLFTCRGCSSWAWNRIKWEESYVYRQLNMETEREGERERNWRSRDTITRGRPLWTLAGVAAFFPLLGPHRQHTRLDVKQPTPRHPRNGQRDRHTTRFVVFWPFLTHLWRKSHTHRQTIERWERNEDINGTSAYQTIIFSLCSLWSIRSSPSSALDFLIAKWSKIVEDYWRV